MKGFSLLLLLLIFNELQGFGQTDASINQKIKLIGKVADSGTGLPLPGTMIINKSTGTGIFGGPGGEFSMFISKDDHLIFSVIGYQTKTICFKDSLWRFQYEIMVELHELRIDLQEVEIFPERSLKEIQREIDALDTDYPHQVKGIEAFESPITYFYHRFSRFEKQKRKAFELYNEENMETILKELFRKYIKADIIELNNKDFDEFILFCRLPEDFIMNASQYDLVMAIKVKYDQFLKLRNQQ